MGNVIREPGKVILSRIHVDGDGLTRTIIRAAANEFGIKEGVEEVLLRGGVRTSGANPGKTPKPFLVKVER
jgi:hypothetical protein